jgi:Zn-dependent membrane protease YugP
MMTLLLLGFAALVAFLPSIWVRSIINKHHSPKDKFNFTGAEFSMELLKTLNINNVKVEITSHGDHYDPNKKIIGLSSENFYNKTLSAITIGSHEVGHAIQDYDNYKPLKWRTTLVKWVMPIERIGAGLMFLSPISMLITKIPFIGLLFLAGGFLSLFATIIIHAVTVPTELDASFNRAVPLLLKTNLLNVSDQRAAKLILLAAALTYLVAALRSLLSVARWWSILRRR